VIGVDQIRQYGVRFSSSAVRSRRFLGSFGYRGRCCARWCAPARASSGTPGREVEPSPKLGEWIEVPTEILEAETKLPKRERRLTQRLFEELRGRGYDGAYVSVHGFVKGWREKRARVPAETFVPPSFAPGEVYQFDWSHETITLQGFPRWRQDISRHPRDRLCSLTSGFS
jgi:hypothetical protein